MTARTSSPARYALALLICAPPARDIASAQAQSAASVGDVLQQFWLQESASAYLPLCAKGEAVTFPVEGVDGGSISMLAVRLG